VRIARIALLTLLAVTWAHEARAEPTLARISFWVPAERMAEFERVYTERVAPLLERHGIVATRPSDRVVPAGVFDRVFPVKDVADVALKRQSLQANPEWSALLVELGARYGAVQTGGPIRSDVRLFSMPADDGTPLADESTGFWRNYGLDEGLFGGSVFSFIHDRDGNMWFGTFGGVSRFDGQTWTTYTTRDGLGHNAVQAMLQDRDGVFWFGTRGGGVTRYDGETWTTFTTEDGLANNSVRSIAEDHDGNIWFGTRGSGVSRFDGQTWLNLDTGDGLVGDVIYAMLADRKGNMWFGDYARGLSRYDGQSFTNFTPAEGLRTPGICRLLEDRDGNIWAGACRAGGTSRYDGHSWVNYTTRDGMSANVVHGILQGRDGDMWFGTGRGVTRFDGETFRIYREGLMNHVIWSSFTDRHGGYWFGSDSGASYYDESWLSIPLDFAVMSIVEDGSGSFWFHLTDGTKIRYDGHLGRQLSQSSSTMGVHSLQDRQGNMWFATMGGGMLRFDGQTWSAFATQDGLASNVLFFNSICQDNDGILWFGTGAGVSRYDGTSFQNITVEDGLAYSDVYSMWADRRGFLWFGTANGLNRYDPSNPDNAFETYTMADGLADPGVWSIAEDGQGTLWFGGTGGATRYDPTATDEEKRFVAFTTEDGLVSNSVWSLLADSRGHVWFGTGSGVSRYDGKVFQTITQRDGLLNNSVWDIVEDDVGDIWFATGKGVSRFRPPSEAPPGIVIDAVVADRRYEGHAELSLTAPLQVVAFEFAARNDFKTRPEAMVYRYRLRGFEDDWQTTNDRRLEYLDLPLGVYTFEVQAVDRDLVYSEQSATVQLTVGLPYTQYGLIASLALAVATAVALGVRVTRQAGKLRNSNDALTMSNTDLEKSRVAAEAANHAKSLFLANMSHEIRTPMNAILGYAQILQRNTTLERSQKRAVEIIQSSGDHLLKLINSVLDISKIEAGRLELDRTDFDLQGLVRTLAMMFELQCREKGLVWHLDSQIDNRLLVQGDENKLRQILINLLGNAIKFTPEGQIGLRVAFEGGDRYLFEVTDTGAGMSAEEQTTVFEAFQQGRAGLREGGTGLGLAISQRQLALMGSQLQLESAEEEGSRFFFVVALPASTVLAPVETQADWSQVRHLAPGQSLKALVVDDVAENRDILQHMLADIGVDIHTANDGQQALDVMDGWLPDIVFLDIRMPVMDGMEALRRIQQNENWRSVKVAAISASALEHEREGYLEAGFIDFIDKPFRFERICSCLAQLLDVRFDFGENAEPQGGTSDGGAADWSSVSLPEELATRLVEAAELYSVTEMDGCFGEMEDLGDDQRRLAAHLRRLRRSHDLETILELVREIRRV
jgi:two-component system, sensor histidine kinase ChiS